MAWADHLSRTTARLMQRYGIAELDPVELQIDKAPILSPTPKGRLTIPVSALSRWGRLKWWLTQTRG